MTDDRRQRAGYGSGSVTKAQTDRLTGIHNRRSFLRLALQEHQQARWMGEPCMLFWIEVSSLPQIQHQYGDDECEAVEVAVGEFLKASFRNCDIAGRLKSGEFAVLARGCSDALPPQVRLESHVGHYSAFFPRPYPFSIKIQSQALH